MKIKAVMSTVLLIIMMSPEKRASCNGKNVLGLDALQFRAPYSLGELLHDGLVSVEEKIREVVSQDELTVSGLDASAQIIEQLSVQYDLMIDKSNMHSMHRDDRDFLQTMIDRIDQMIQALETTRSLSGVGQDAVQKNLELLSDLKDRLAA